MAGVTKRSMGIFEDYSRRGQESAKRLYRIIMYDLQCYKGMFALRDYEYVKRRIE